MHENKLFPPLESVSIFGTQISYMLTSLIALYTLSATSVEVGLLTAINYVPVVILGILFGSIIDSGKPIRIAIRSSIFRILLIVLLSIIFITGYGDMKLLVIFSFLLSTASASYDISVQSIIPTIYEKGDIPRINSQFELGRSVGNTVGPTLASFLVAAGGAGLGFIFLNLTYILGLLGLKSLGSKDAKMVQKQNRGKLSRILRDMAEGVDYLVGRRDIMAAVMMGCVGNISSSALSALAFFYLKSEFYYTAVQIGYVASISGCLSIIIALFSRKIAGRGNAFSVMYISVLVIIISTVVFSHIVFSGILGVITSGLLLGAVYSSNIIFNIRMISYRQVTIPLNFFSAVKLCF